MAKGAAGKKIAVVGATGLIGGAILERLGAVGYSPGEVMAVASARSVGKRVDFGDSGLWVEDLAEADFDGVELVILAVPAEVAAAHAAAIVACGCVVFDHSGVLAAADAPLVSASINPAMLIGQPRVALPYSLTQAVAAVVKPILQQSYVQRILVTALMPVSYAGREPMKELAGQTVSLLGGVPPEKQFFSEQVAFNLLPGIGADDEQSVTALEARVIGELRVLFDDDLLPVDVSCALAPVFFGISAYVEIEVASALEMATLRDILSKVPDLVLVSAGQRDAALSPVACAAGDGEVRLGRLRLDEEERRRVSFWMAFDNMGTATSHNTVTLANFLLKRYQ